MAHSSFETQRGLEKKIRFLATLSGFYQDKESSDQILT